MQGSRLQPNDCIFQPFFETAEVFFLQLGLLVCAQPANFPTLFFNVEKQRGRESASEGLRVWEGRVSERTVNCAGHIICTRRCLSLLTCVTSQLSLRWGNKPLMDSYNSVSPSSATKVEEEKSHESDSEEAVVAKKVRKRHFGQEWLR